MTCTRAQVLALLEMIEAEMKCEHDRQKLRHYVELIRSHAWHEIQRELFYKP